MNLKDDRLLRNCSFINGEWVSSDATFAVTDPASGDTITEVPDHGEVETRAAVEAAHDALAGWQAHTAGERADILRNWHELMIRHKDDLALIMTTEQGKPLSESRGEIEYGASFILWFAEEARRVYGDVIPTHKNGSRIVVIKQPIGVVGAVTPWNFPNAMISRKVAPALAAGCTFVVKPAAETPLSALAMAELATRAGVPEGVFNVITTDRAKEVGAVLTGHPLVRKFTFTGSTPVGKQLIKQCADTVKKVSMELGGNAPFIVFDDADIDAAVDGAMSAKYRNSGQTCVCANRFLVQDAVYDEFATKFSKRVAAMKVGPGIEDDVDVGPLINEAAIEKVSNLVSDAVNKGAKVQTGGSRHSKDELYFQPTVLTEATTRMGLATEEIFGPVAPLFRFNSVEEAIRMANATEFGLAAYFYARDIGRIWKVAEALDYGMVGINEGLISTTVAPFGGVKESGSGREGSKYGIDEFVEIKYMLMGGLDQPD
ncbi:MAG: NAD-dependent succinate-semialdehyde dehydrogenase [Gammaproteobacteria bacterium]|nr:NAD-dependent succinate-semialdehyde dehydrogenase [Gammaproteobacteria bacterium]